MASRKPVIAAFDFDKTLVRMNSLPDFMRYVAHRRQRSYYGTLITLTPSLLGWVLRIVPTQRAKEKMLTSFIGGLSTKTFTAYCQDYAQRLASKTDGLALARLQWHQQQGHTVLIISASAEDWIKPWASSHNVGIVLATRLQKSKKQVTGKLAGPNCFGPEKAKRLLAQYPDRATYTLYAYGDGQSDQQLFELADFVYQKRFS